MKKIIYSIMSLIIMLLCCSCSESENNYNIDDSDGKKIVNITVLEYDDNLKGYVQSFNATNKEYKVVVKAFVEEFPQGETYYFDKDIEKLNTELIAGNIPDIIVDTGSFLPIQSYINKGLLTDIYPLMDADQDFAKEQYLQNAFSASEKDGKLYEIFPTFHIQTVYAKTSEVGVNYGWTLDEFANYIELKQNSKLIISGFTKQYFVTKMISRLFLDSETGTYNFNHDEFMKLLQIAERFPLEYPFEYNNFTIDLGISEGNPIMGYNMLSNPRQIREWEIVNAGEEISFIGLPQQNGTILSGKGSSFVPSMKMVIMNKAKEKQGAWEFVKFTLDKQTISSNIYIPVKLSLIESILEESKENPLNSSKEYFISYPNNGIWYDVVVGNNTDEDNVKFMNLLKSVNHVYSYNSVIENIINEEVANYFTGEQSINQVADIIENRLNLYMNEMS